MPFNLSRNTIILLTILTVVALTGLLFCINRFMVIDGVQKEITTLNAELAGLHSTLKKERITQQTIKNLDRDYLKSAYFNRDDQYVESYIRSVFESFRIKTALYRSTLSEDNYTEVDVSFTVGIIDFFKLVKTLETGDKMIVIKRLSVKSTAPPKVQITMKLGGYYKESR